MSDIATESAAPRQRISTRSGPVDYLVVEFPAGASNFTGEMAKELLALVDAGTIRVIDVLILTKNEDGTVEATELSDIEELGELQALEAQLAELLAEEDVDHLAAAMEPGSTAGRPHLGEPVGRAVRVGGSPLRWPADRQRTDSRFRRSSPRSRPMKRLRRKETEMPLRAARVGRVGVIGHPVAKTAVVAKAVTPGPRPSRRPRSWPRPSLPGGWVAAGASSRPGSRSAS